MTRQHVYLLVGALALIAVCVAGFFYTFEQKWVTETTPSTGEARYNRFYALELTLENMGQPSSSSISMARTLPLLKPGDTVVIGDDVGRITFDQATALVAWVRSGGHLVFSPMAYTGHGVPLLEQLGLLDVRQGSFLCASLQTDAKASADQKPPETSLCGPGFRLRPSILAQASVTVGNDDKGLAFARVPMGLGTVSLLNDIGPISGERLKNAPEQEFAWRLLAPNFGRGHCYLLYELIGTSFWVNLFLRGWPAVLASLLLLAGWMAARSQRFGPLMPVPASHRRALTEHIQAVGEFLFRRDGGRSLHRLACDSVLTRLRRRDPASAMLKDAELYDWLAQRSQLESARVEQAFRSPANAAAFRISIHTLARLRSHL
ncbi:hypothetical protein ISP13_02395 [Dyella lipolytica]|uniref:DUF4350 domain-containing protein n=1 Tax=Dyella lipolytica TaxID=1867835 RepID=A0ABW8IR02_9GAMM